MSLEEFIMHKRKRVFICLIMIVGILLLSCTTQDKQEKRPVIAVSVISETHNWPIGVLHYAEQEVKAVAQENDWDYKFVVGADANEQSNQVIDLINEEVDCIIMLPMDGASLKTAAMSVQAADIPLVIFDREIPDFAPTATVKGDNTGIGTMTADIFNGIFPDGTTVLELMGDTSTVPQQRTDGYDEKINHNFIKEQVGFTGWQREDSKALFMDWVDTHTQEEIDKVGAIFTHDDEIALGVLDALREYEKTGDKTFHNLEVIAGSAGDKEMYYEIIHERKYMLFSLTYSPDMVKAAIRKGEKVIKGEEYEEMDIIPTMEVNRKNINQYYDANAPY